MLIELPNIPVFPFKEMNNLIEPIKMGLKMSI
jgi:hypothetical protein